MTTDENIENSTKKEENTEKIKKNKTTNEDVQLFLLPNNNNLKEVEDSNSINTVNNDEIIDNTNHDLDEIEDLNLTDTINNDEIIDDTNDDLEENDDENNELKNFYTKKEFRKIKKEFRKNYKSEKRSYFWKSLSKKNKDYKLNDYVGKYKFQHIDTGDEIQLINVNKFYKNGNKYERVLKNINLTLPYGKIICILGPSGSGKTTLLNIISGLITADFGEVIVNNTNLTSLKEKERTNFRNKYISFVFQTYNLLLTLKAKDNILLGSDLTKSDEKINLRKLVSDLNIENQIFKDVNHLSGGQQQRISISRALAKNPLILIADEPTGALDEDNTEIVLKIFKEVQEKYQTTIFLVTHDEKVTEIADCVIRFKDGEIKDLVWK